MPTITAIEPQKKKGRFNIYLNGKFAFWIDRETLVCEGLEIGKEISESDAERLGHIGELNRLMDKALRFLSSRPRSEREVRDYLWKKVRIAKEKSRAPDRGASLTLGNSDSSSWQFSENSGFLIEEVVSKLKGLNYVDDEVFVSWWIEQRIRFRPRGKFLLRSELCAKGIDRDLIETKLAEYSLDDEVSWAKRVLEKKIPHYEELEPRRRKEKLSACLARRGFSWEVVERALASSLLQK